jgi:hypothetical protein
MRKTLACLALAALLLTAAPALAANRTCNLTLVGQGICRDSTHYVLAYDAPVSHFADLRDAVLDEYGYQTEIVCGTSRQYEPLLNGTNSDVLSAAGQSQGDCSTVGQPTANPQSSADFADAVIKMEMQNRVIQWKYNAAQEAAGDVTQVPTPDVGASP